MEFHLFCHGIFCAFLIIHLEAKPFSLNKAIAENSERKLFETLTNISPENTDETFSLKGALKPSSATKKLKEIGDILLVNTLKKKRSPLKHKRKINSKKPTLAIKPRFKRKNFARHREIYNDEGLNRRYLPLLRSISMLFDDILSTDSQSSEDEGFTSNNARRDFECSCSHQGDLEPSQSGTRKKTTATETSSTEVPVQIETTTKEADITTPLYISTIRQNTIIPALLSRNTPSTRRNYNGIGKRNSSTRYRNIENTITRNRGNSEYDTRERGNETYTQNNEENTKHAAQYSENRDAFGRGRLSGDTGGDRNSTTTTETAVTTQAAATKDIWRYVDEFKGQNSIEARGDTTESTVHASRNQTESPIYAPGFSGRLRGHTTKNKIVNYSEPLQSKEFYEKGVFNVTLGIPSGKRRVVGAGFLTEKDKKDRTANERLDPLTSIQSSKTPAVMIIDGYSVARDKNGQNQLSKKQYNLINK